MVVSLPEYTFTCTRIAGNQNIKSFKDYFFIPMKLVNFIIKRYVTVQLEEAILLRVAERARVVVNPQFEEFCMMNE